MSECKAYRREVEEAADGGSVSGSARAHVSSCRACGDEVRERERLRALVGGLGKVEAPADFEFRLRARMAASKTDGGRGLFANRWLYGFAPVAVAACFVVVSATLYLRQAARTTTPAVAPAVASSPARNVGPGRTAPADVQGRTTDSAVKAGPAEVASVKNQKSVRGSGARARQAREVASRVERRADAVQKTAVSSVVAAPVLRPLTIAVKAQTEPLRMIVRDERGAERVVPVRAVSFGAQDFIAREATARQAAATEVGGVW